MMSATIYRFPSRIPAAEHATLEWLRSLERARTGLGARCSTQHVSKRRWVDHCVRGAEPVQALLAELRDTD